VVEWFQEMNKVLVRRWRKQIPSLAFVHIPINAMAAFQAQGVDPYTEPGINDDDPLDQQGIVDGIYTGQDIPFMEALLETRGLIALFSAHDHGDDWSVIPLLCHTSLSYPDTTNSSIICRCFKWTGRLPGMDLTGRGLNVCFGRHSGYGGYGHWVRGSRQILLDERILDVTIETWIRLENGDISGAVALNDSYGTDVYPPVKYL
jgi:hypothetical protein